MLNKQTIRRHLAACALVLVLVHSALSLVPFQGQSFSLRATVTQVEQGSNQTVIRRRLAGRTHESYSSSQARALISYNLELVRGQAQFGELYHEATTKHTLNLDHLANECKAIKSNELSLLLNLDLTSLELDLMSDHVIGLARLVLFVQHHKDKLQMVGIPSDKHNMQTLEYSYIMGDIQLNVFYSGLAVAKDPDAPPMQIVVSGRKQISIVDFSHISLALEEIMDTSERTVRRDKFAFPQECIHQIAGEPLENWRMLSRFSFEAKILFETPQFRLSYQLPRTSVSYDLDLDTVSLSYNNAKEGSKLVTTKKVANYKIKRVYQVFEQASLGVNSTKQECYVFKIGDVDREPTVSEVLVGGNVMVYLGQAIVRGRRTWLYAVVKNTTPRWLEQPVEYRFRGMSKTRDTVRGVDASNEELTTLVYITQDDLLMQLEIYKGKNKVTVEMFNFIWELDRPASELFSLHLACSKSEATKHAKVEVLLNKLDGLKFLETPPNGVLNLRFLSLIQNSLFIPASMVYDLETRMVKQMDLFASFRVASHSDNVAELTYLGKGDLKVGYKGEKLLEMTTNTFQICLQVAARQKLPIAYFGYEMQSRRCWIAGSKEGFAVVDNDSHLDNKLLEVFQIQQDTHGTLIYGGEDGRWLESNNRQWFTRTFLGTKVTMRDFKVATRSLGLQVKKLQVEVMDEQQVGLVNLGTKYRGFSLPKESPNRRFVASDHSWNHQDKRNLDTSLVECRSGCSASDTCQSYSVCQRPEGLECVLSPLNFQSDTTVEQLKRLSPDGALGERLTVAIGNGKNATLVRRASCDLYIKLYLDHFEYDQPHLQKLSSIQNLEPVSSDEECAKKCAKLNLRVLAQDASFANQLAPLINSRVTEQQLEDLDALMTRRRENSERLCRSFLYLNNAQSDDQILRAYVGLDENDTSTVDGYCSLEVTHPFDGDTTKVRPKSTLTDVQLVTILRFRRYNFKLSSFYNLQKGVRLFATDLSTTEQVAYTLAQRRSRDLRKADFDKLKLLAESGSNFQETFNLEEEKCAAACFFGKTDHLLGPWPTCNSFDWSYDERSQRSVCHLNSITLQQAIGNQMSNLIDDTSHESHWIRWGHYEPGFLLASNLDDAMEAELELEDSSWFKVKAAYLGGGVLFVISLLAIAGGIFMGAKAGQKLLEIQEAKKQSDQERVRIAELDFSNQVNADGVISE